MSDKFALSDMYLSSRQSGLVVLTSWVDGPEITFLVEEVLTQPVDGLLLALMEWKSPAPPYGRVMKAYVRDGFPPAEALARAGRREKDDHLPAVIAGIKGADPDTTLQAICERLEVMCECTPRDRTRWQPSSVKMLLERTERLGLMP